MQNASKAHKLGATMKICSNVLKKNGARKESIIAHFLGLMHYQTGKAHKILIRLVPAERTESGISGVAKSLSPLFTSLSLSLSGLSGFLPFSDG